MVKSFGLIFLIWGYHSTVSSQEKEFSHIQDSIDYITDSIAKPVEETLEYNYWKPRYYDSIPVQNQLLPPGASQPFDVVIKRYHNQEFDYVESISDKLSFIDKLIERINAFIQSLFPKRNIDVEKPFFNILALLGGFIVLFLSYRLFFSGKKVYINLKNETIEEEEQIAYIERNLLQVDLKNYIKEAVDRENYALAVRYQQLSNIQILHDKGHFVWKHTLTNVELAGELKIEELKKEFLRCSQIFDHVWFGDFVIEKEDYRRYQQEFQGFQKKWS